ncbi:MAG: Oligopeptidase A (EC [uncultured Sulfurovum sp.]|uniref:oligopeptidase A n=1 Tax=uncultured Sulfurovum sp. TaxID=269237 RepID=A0A6S6TG88_9BACT|nr:MAG: Oligopeptidase A (EC [uncultured Sulfurovum sp.]
MPHFNLFRYNPNTTQIGQKMPFQEFKIDNLEEFPKELESMLASQLARIDSIVKSKDESYEKVMKPLQDLDEELSAFFTPLSHLNSVENSKVTQKAYEESLPQLSKFSSNISQNEALFSKIKKIKSEDPQARTVIEHDIRGFVLSGADLPLEQKKELEAIDLKLSELGNSFSQNLLNATNAFEMIIEDEKDVAEIPESDLSLARIVEEGKTVYKFTLQIPSYLTYMTYGSSRELRKTMAKAYASRAPENAKVIDQLLELRQKKAILLGFKNFSAYSLATKDAKNTDEVTKFLEELGVKSLPQAKEELAELEAFALKLDGIDDLQGYDVAYYSEKLKKEKFHFDDSMTKPYFEQSKVLNGLLEVVSELFSVEFKASTATIWNDKVKPFEIYKLAKDGSNKLAGRIYFDLEARESKRGGAWMHNWETHHVDAKGNKHLPTVFVVCNFSPSTKENPSLLRHDDVVTLFHEMGHAIHHLFGTCNERSVSGINGVAWDVVEFPSQFLEAFSYEKPILKRFAFHYETNEPMSDELLNKIKETKNYQAALGILRQVELSLFDFNLHKMLYQGEEVQALIDGIRETTALLTVPKYNKFQNGFAHIFAGGYAAGYYSYKWAEVLSADAFYECLDKESGFNQEKADGYLKYILNKGGSQEMSSLYKQWLGREPKVESLLKLYGIEE